MKTASYIIIGALAVVLTVFPIPAFAARNGGPGGGGPGGGNPGGSGPGGGGPGGGGGNQTADAAGALYGDLYVIERDGAGAPITRAVAYVDIETGQTVTVSCVQPIASEALGACKLLPLNGEKEDFNPELEDACGVQADYLDYIQEVTFGRESVARSPAGVTDKSYAEALKTINVAAGGQCACDYSCSGTDPRAVKQDAAGRITLCIPLEDGAGYAWKTIDAPLENLGLYREVMTKGCLGTVSEQKVGEEGVSVVVTAALDPTGIYYLANSPLASLVCDYATSLPATIADAVNQEINCTVTPDPVDGQPDTPCWWESPVSTAPVGDGDMMAGTVFIAAAADKTSPVTLDEIINVNNYLQVNALTYTEEKKEQVLTIDYFPFLAPDGDGPEGWFAYTRSIDAFQPGTFARLLVADTTGTLFTSSDVDVFGATPPGVNLGSVAITVCRSGSPLANETGELVVCNDALTNPVYVKGVTYGCGGANWFAQAAEDARKTIWYLHNWRVPEIEY